MAIAIGGHAAAGTAAFSPVSTISTSGVTTQATGSSFVILVCSSSAIAASPPVSDSFSNTYVQKASALVYFGSLYVYAYLCSNGSGGASHTATANFSASSSVALFFDEVTGAAASPYDVSATGSNGGGSSVYSGQSVTTTNANDLILSLLDTNGDGATITDPTGWNAILDSVGAGSSGAACAAVSYQVESSTGTYSDTYTSTTTGGGALVAIALKAAAGGGNVTAALTGVSASGTVGTLAVALSLALSGNTGTGSVGTVTPGDTLALTQVSGTGSVGTVTPSGGGNVTVALTQVIATGSVGTLAPSTSVPLTQNAATGSVGTLGVSAQLALTQVSATGSVGFVTPSTAPALTGVSATGSVGSISLVSSSVALTGVSATGSVGNLTASGGGGGGGSGLSGFIGFLANPSILINKP